MVQTKLTSVKLTDQAQTLRRYKNTLSASCLSQALSVATGA